MLASSIMQKPVVISANAQGKDALDLAIETGHRMLPVLDDAQHVVGMFSSFAVLGYLVPDYIVSGHLADVSYAPDFGLLRKHYDELENKKVADLMSPKPFIIKPEESILSAAAALLTSTGHDGVLVVDAAGVLLGIITPADVLNSLRTEESLLA